MPIIKIGPKHQVTIPKDAFQRLHLESGDILEAHVEGKKLVLVPKRLTEKVPAVKLTSDEQKALSSTRRKILKIRKDLLHSRGLTLREAKAAAKVGLIDPDQMYWWLEEWQKSEREAEAEEKAGKSAGPFTSGDELLRSLEQDARRMRRKSA